MERLNSAEWLAMTVFIAEIQSFKSRNLTDQEFIVMMWMEKEVEKLKKRSS